MKELTESLDDKVVKGLQNKIAEYETEIFDLKVILTKKDEEIKNLKDENSSLNSELEQGKTKLLELENQVKDITSAKDIISAEVGDLKAQNETLNNKINELNKLYREEKERYSKEIEFKIYKIKTILEILELD